jgi:superfamily II DNA or RNA helicase
MTDIKLRDYQREAVDSIQRSWSEGIIRPTCVLPTGAGKTVTFAGLIESNLERLRRDGQRVLVLAHREELLEQAEAKIKALVPGVWTAIVKGSRGSKKHQFADVVVASVQTLARPKRRAAVDRIGMVIVDECHRYASRTYKEVLEHYGCMKDTPTVGFTATLTRMDGGLPEVWESVAYQKRIHWMIKEGYLVPPVAKTIEVPGLNLATTRVTAGDLNTKDLADALEGSEAFRVIADTWQEQAADRPTIAFLPNVATAHRLAAEFARRGVTSSVVTGEMGSTQRRSAYEGFESGRTQVLVSCMILTEGFDAPCTSCVIIGRPTLNPGLYQQMVGRGLRLCPENGKTDCLVLDVAGASLKHSLAGCNDLESDCEARCDCGCLTCGCGTSCKCGVRKCGCRCIEQHEGPTKHCRCAGSPECGCGCPGDMDGTGLDGCACDLNPACDCRGGGDAKETKEVDAEVLATLKDVDILGEELGKSSLSWLRTDAGIPFLVSGQTSALFVLQAPTSGFFMGRVDSFHDRAPVTRLDDGPKPLDEALKALEGLAADSGWTYNTKRASWRRSPVSDQQARMLRGLGVDVTEGMKKGQASDAISVVKVSRTLDARFGDRAPSPS